MAAAYCSSKAALKSAIESIELDYSNTNVKFRLFYPGFVETPLTDKNDFKMPFIKSPEFAADQMFKGLVESKAFEITFPKALTTILKILRILPYRLYLFLVDKGVKR